MLKHDPSATHSEGICRLDILDLAELEDLGADQATQPGPGSNSHNHTKIDKSLVCRDNRFFFSQSNLENQHRRRNQENLRNRIECGIDILDNIVDPPAYIS